MLLPMPPWRVAAKTNIGDEVPPCYKRGLMWALVRKATSHIGVVHLGVNHLAQLNEDGTSEQVEH